MTPSAHFSRRALLAGSLSSLRAAANLPPVRTITKGPKHHWFGYYDKLQFDPTNRYVLGNQVTFEHRSPTPEDTIRVGMVDLQDGDRWIDLGESRAWCWQQGCMLQWIPGSRTDVIWNDGQDSRFVSHILNVQTGKKQTLPSPIYALAPNGKWAVSTDFRRLHHTRPGYGYAGVPDPNRELLAPKDSGIWQMDLATGRTQLLFSIADAAGIPFPHGDWTGARHWFNHLLVAPGGRRFCFLHRWQSPSMRTRLTRMFTMDPDGGNPYILIPYGGCSHFVWRDPRHMFAWSFHPSHKDRFYLWHDRTDQVEVIGPDVMRADGHGTYLPGNRWILNDTYPDSNRNQNPFLYHVATRRVVPLGDFHSPKQYTGEWRCDTHPRFSPNGRLVTIDSPHDGQGRQMHLIDISSIV